MSRNGKTWGATWPWPNGAPFALTVIDDTDNATRDGVKPFYDALIRHGLRTTKTVWALPNVCGDRFVGESLSDRGYRDWIASLRDASFEIGWHGARSGGTLRDLHDEALQLFRDTLGRWPRTYANHAQNPECLYWGESRFDVAILRMLYARIRPGGTGFTGDDPASPYYWADFCRDRISYVRGFTFRNIVTTQADPFMPYFDSKRPHARAWFSASDGDDVEAFARLLCATNLDRLERSGGACIVYAHAASGFVRDGRLDARVEAILAELERRGGWYVPVDRLLDHMCAERGLHQLSSREHRTLERRWAVDRIVPALKATRSRMFAAK